MSHQDDVDRQNLEQLLAESSPGQRLIVLRYGRDHLLRDPRYLWTLIAQEAQRRLGEGAAEDDAINVVPGILNDLKLHLTAGG